MFIILLKISRGYVYSGLASLPCLYFFFYFFLYAPYFLAVGGRPVLFLFLPVPSFLAVGGRPSIQQNSSTKYLRSIEKKKLKAV